MRQQYKVNICPQRKFKHTHANPSKIVQYFISAEEIEWDFSPERRWELELYQTTEEDRCVVIAGWGIALSFVVILFANEIIHVSRSPGNVFVGKGKNQIGSRYKKVVYREYTDDSFNVQKKQQPSQLHLGLLGKFNSSLSNFLFLSRKN